MGMATLKNISTTKNIDNRSMNHIFDSNNVSDYALTFVARCSLSN